LCAAPAATAAPPEPPQSDTSPPGSRPDFSVHWAVSAVPGSGWADGIDFAGIPISTRLIESGPLGLYPVAGPHIADADPTWQARHFEALARDVDRLIPNPAYDGLVALDWQAWPPLWRDAPDEPSDLPADAEDRDFKSDWRAHLRAMRPQLLAGLAPEQQERVFEATYEDAARTILAASLRECRRLRPAATWGFIGLGGISWRDSTSGDLAAARAANDRLRPIWDAAGALFPILVAHDLADDSDPLPGSGARARLHDQWRCDSVTEAVRLAAGKPVHAFLWLRAGDRAAIDADTDASPPFPDQLTLRRSLDAPRRCGAAGLVIWEYLDTQHRAVLFRDYFAETLGPAVLAIFAAPQAAPGSSAAAATQRMVRTPDGRLILATLSPDGTPDLPPSLWPGEPPAPLAPSPAPDPTPSRPRTAPRPATGPLALLGLDDPDPVGGDPDVLSTPARATPAGSATPTAPGTPAPAATAAAQKAPPPRQIEISMPPAPPAKGSKRKPLPIVVRTMPDRDAAGLSSAPIPVPPKSRALPPWVYAPAPEPPPR
jgi:hypothetical protein